METYPIILGGVKKHTGEIVNVRFPYTGETICKGLPGKRERFEGSSCCRSAGI